MPGTRPLDYAAAVDLPSKSRPQRSSPVGEIYKTRSSYVTASKVGPTMTAKKTPSYYSAPIRSSRVDQMSNKASMTGSALAVGGKFGRMGAGAVAMNVAGMGSYMSGGHYTQGAVAGTVTSGLAVGGMGLASYMMKSNLKSGKIPMNSFTKGMARGMATMVGTGTRRYTFGAGALLGGMMFGGNKSHAGGFNKNRGNSFGR